MSRAIHRRLVALERREKPLPELGSFIQRTGRPPVPGCQQEYETRAELYARGEAWRAESPSTRWPELFFITRKGST